MIFDFEPWQLDIDIDLVFFLKAKQFLVYL